MRSKKTDGLSGLAGINPGLLSSIFLILVFVAAVLVRVDELEKRTFWNVDQSLTMWQIKKVAVDNKIGLIGLHYFSLADGAIYRTPFYNWLMAIPANFFGLRVKVMSMIYLLASLASLGVVMVSLKRIGGSLAWKLGAILYAFSWLLASREMMIRPGVLLIPMSAVTLWLVLVKRDKGRWWESALLGLGLGLGFSLHLSVVFLIMGVALFWLIASKGEAIKKIFLLGMGVGVMLLPLLVFNFRHDFILNRGVVRMMTGKAVDGGRATLAQRFEIGTETLGCQVGNLVGYGCADFWMVVVFVTVGAGLLLTRKRSRRFVIYFLAQTGMAVLGVALAGRLGYSSNFYIVYLIPLFVVFGALVLERVLEGRLWIVAIVLLTVFLQKNLSLFINYQDSNSYYHKKKLAEYIYSQHNDGRIGVQFWDQETLAYDFVFWEVAAEMGVAYEKVNLIELWGSDEADMVVYLNENPDLKGKTVEFGDSKLMVLY